jgi:hypothetical protein
LEIQVDRVITHRQAAAEVGEHCFLGVSIAIGKREKKRLKKKDFERKKESSKSAYFNLLLFPGLPWRNLSWYRRAKRTQAAPLIA